VSVIQFDNDARIICSAARLLDAPFKLSINGGGTSFTPALRLAQPCLAYNRSQYIPILIFMSDGESWDGEEALGVLKEIRRSDNRLQVHIIEFNQNSAYLREMQSVGCGNLHSCNEMNLVDTFEEISKASSVALKELGKSVGESLSKHIGERIAVDYL
jgi:uncharacterized protein YegL